MLSRRAILTIGCQGLPLLLGGCATLGKDAQVRAFIVGADYPRYGKAPGELGLHNAVKDATTIARSLAGTRNCDAPILMTNPSLNDWRETLATYQQGLRPTDFTVFYYAGHAFQSDAQLAFLCDDGASAVSAEQVLQFLLTGVRGVFFIVDACRAPLAPALRRQGVGSVPVQNLLARGVKLEEKVKTFDLAPETFRPVNPSEMTLPRTYQINISVAGKVKFLYSTDGRQFASDGDSEEGGGPFARIAAQELTQRVELEELVSRITNKVSKQTHGTEFPQTPASAGELDFAMYLMGPPLNVSLVEPRGDPYV